MHLQALSVKDFQRHKLREIKLSRWITSIQGPTDAGKSSLLRALRWVCLNDQRGVEFVREGARRAVVALGFRHKKQDHKVSRVRGGQENTYMLDDTIFRSFSANVPEDVARVLRVNEINFQGQHDPPFWFNETAGEVSRQLNSVIDLSVIDQVLSVIAATVREADARVKLCAERVEALETESAQLEPQLERIEEFEKLSAQQKAFAQRQQAAGELDTLLTRVRYYQTHIENGRQHVTAGATLNEQIDSWFARSRKCQKLAKLLGQISQLEGKQSPPDFDTVAQAYKAWTLSHNRTEALQSLLEQIEAGEETAKLAARQSESFEKIFHASIKGERCPLCQSSL